ncbi:hypothetical protein AX14_011034, partial [Amanita brunnescens Koide BX004]
MYLLGLELGEDWKVCVDGWAIVEGARRGLKGSFPTTNRLHEWKDWTAKGRKGEQPYHLTPTKNDTKEFGLAWINWWHKLQPSFQHNETDHMPLPLFTHPHPEPEVMDIWEPLRKGGPNGLVVVLILLSWWGQKASAGMETAKQWHDACIDLRRTLEVMQMMAQ